ncbi:hypothetical protein J1614_004431 [Plenodomus biglobosus]|nr:hypothetical protein J1614_004431 [Plenodomus biglobosus]
MRLPDQIRHAIVACLVLLWLCASAATDETHYIVATFDGQRVRVKDNRQPALCTADYGDCLGESTFNVTRFDAAYYKDNMTIIFHLADETGLQEEAIVMKLQHQSKTLSACPTKTGVSIEAAGIIPIKQNDISGIPELALSIPDFEGQAILRIFSNSTQAKIGCFTAQITNGNTFRQREAVISVLAAFALLTIVSSFATTIYGDSVLFMRKHYAHSLSVSIVFAVWHHIFYSGALSMNWPSILVAFWSNYTWAGGMIYSKSMQNTINDFIGSNKGSTSHVGTTAAIMNNANLGGVSSHRCHTPVYLVLPGSIEQAGGCRAIVISRVQSGPGQRESPARRRRRSIWRISSKIWPRRNTCGVAVKTRPNVTELDMA